MFPLRVYFWLPSFFCLLNGSWAELLPFPSELADKLQATLSEKVDVSALEGMSYSIAVPGYEVWTGTYGVKETINNTPINQDTVFGIASITKTYTAAMIMQLRDEGFLDLDDTLEHYLGPIANVDSEITIRQLLSMVSGVYNFSNHSSNPTGHAVANPAIRYEAIEVMQQYLRAPVFAPNTSYQYSNSNFILLGILIEHLTGKSFAENLHTRLTVPLELNDTYMGGSDLLPVNFAYTDYNRDGVIDPARDTAKDSIASLYSTAGGMYSTSSDLVLWAQALYGGNIIAPASVAEMVDFDANEHSSTYGFGTIKENRAGKEMWGHGGLLSYHSYVDFSPESGIAFAFLANIDRGFSVSSYWPQYDMVLLVLENPIPQPMDFKPIPDLLVGDFVTLDASTPASLIGLPIDFEVVGAPATLNEGKLLVSGVGEMSVSATQAATDFYQEARVDQSFKVYSVNGDDDNDGYPNFLELALDMDPAYAGDAPCAQVLIEEDLAGIIYSAVRDDCDYIVEWSTDLQVWVRSGVEEIVLPDSDLILATLSVTPGQAIFMRIHVTRH